jgi:hypothetical protein
VPVLLKGLSDSDDAVRIVTAGSLIRQLARESRSPRHR